MVIGKLPAVTHRYHANGRVPRCYGRRFLKMSKDELPNETRRNRLRWYGCVVRKNEDDLVNRCMAYEVDVVNPRGRSKKTWKQIVELDLKHMNLSASDALDCNK